MKTNNNEPIESKVTLFDEDDKSTWPGQDQVVLCRAKVANPVLQSEICICRFDSWDGDATFFDGNYCRRVIAWQPLPELL